MQKRTRIVFFALALNLATLYAGNSRSERETVLAAMAARPGDPWPRGEGHVLLAIPGSLEGIKAYHEPGGSFSPAVGTFGLSFWVVNNDGTLLTTSDQLPLTALQQHYVWPARDGIPAIETKTPYYDARWTHTGNEQWQLHFSPHAKGKERLFVVLRSVGPAGGPINDLAWTGKTLHVNKTWSIDGAGLSLAALGHEGDPNWLTSKNTDPHWHGTDGWGYARFAVAGAGPIDIVIKGPPVSNYPLPFEGTQSKVLADLPDTRFAESMNAQVANLMMGLVRNETRPGDPTNYPLAWLRDGAYTVTALARAGQLETASALARFFAERDFFGGFGPEADAPGLSLWSLEEVAQRRQEPQFDQYLWPHVVRKASFIHEMLNAKTPIYREPYGPIVPGHRSEKDLTLVCDPAKGGLIMGRMDWHRPILFINAVSYRGLLSAAELAERSHHLSKAAEWRAEAARLSEAWLAAFDNPKWENDRTYISALWQTWILGNHPAQFEQRLRQRWEKSHDPDGNPRERPLWTYFNIAEAHQWLLLDRPARTWDSLSWFWAHQASPGLYTWWEGTGEENTFHGWDHVRGWLKPPYVTPHYWTAAEMLLLQMDMLAYLDLRGTSTIVIGAGVKPEWLKRPMHVKNAAAGPGTVDWTWNGEEIFVTVHHGTLPVRLSPIFPKDIVPKVTYEPR